MQTQVCLSPKVAFLLLHQLHPIYVSGWLPTPMDKRVLPLGYSVYQVKVLAISIKAQMASHSQAFPEAVRFPFNEWFMKATETGTPDFTVTEDPQKQLPRERVFFS